MKCAFAYSRVNSRVTLRIVALCGFWRRHMPSLKPMDIKIYDHLIEPRVLIGMYSEQSEVK